MRATNIANFAYWLLFPGFFLYYFAAAAGGVPLERGYFGGALVLVVAYYLTLGSPDLADRLNRTPAISGPFILLVAWCCTWVAVQGVVSVTVPDGAISQIGIMLLGWVALFVIGIYLDPDAKEFRRWLFAALALMVLIVAIYTDPQYLIFNPRRAFEDMDVPSYQGFARSGMLTCIALLAAAHAMWRRWLLTILSTTLLFLLGARSEFFGFVVAVAAVEARALLQPRYLALASICVVAIVVAVLAGMFGDSRQLEVLDLAHATSWLARQDMTLFAWNEIKESPLAGVFAGHFLLDEAGGSYAHNALSAWVSFGAAGFFLYMWTSIASCWTACKRPARKEFRTARWRLAVYLNVSSLALILMAKSVFWPIPALAWGMTAGLILERSRRRAGTEKTIIVRTFDDLSVARNDP